MGLCLRCRITALVCVAVNTLLSMFSLLRRKHPAGGRGGVGGGGGSAEGGEPLRQQSSSFKRKTDSDQSI